MFFPSRPSSDCPSIRSPKDRKTDICFSNANKIGIDDSLCRKVAMSDLCSRNAGIGLPVDLARIGKVMFSSL